MNAVVIALGVLFVPALAIGSFFTPVFAAEIQAIIVRDASTRTTDAYDPYPIEISVGDTVTWTNNDITPHTVTSGSNGTTDGKFNSSPDFNPLMAPQQKFSHKFEEAGEFPYYCGLHINMVGTVKVAGTPLEQVSSVTVTVDGTDYEIIAKSATTNIIEAAVESNQEYTARFDKAGEVKLTLPKAVFSEVTSVKFGDQEIGPKLISEDDSTMTIAFTLPQDNLTVVIVPEFPVVAALLVAAIGGLIAYFRLGPIRRTGL